MTSSRVMAYIKQLHLIPKLRRLNGNEGETI